MFFLLALVLVMLASGGAFLVRRGLTYKDEPTQQGLERMSSTLAERMADVRRNQRERSPSPSSAAGEARGRQDERRKLAAIAGRGGRGMGEGGGVRPLSRRSFLVLPEPKAGGGGGDRRGEADAGNDAPSSPPREDSPLLGKPQQRRRGKEASSAVGAAGTAGPSSLSSVSSSLRQRPSAMAAFAGDEGGGVGRGEEGGKWHGDEEKAIVIDWGDEEDAIPISGGGGGIGSDYGSEAGSRRTTVSAAPTTLSAADEALLGTFMEVLTEGLPIKIHRSSRKARKTTLWLKDGNTLVWASKRAIGTKQWHKLKLATATSVQAGKGGSDSLIIGSGERADEDTCFSLSFPGVSMGFEAASELERDALVQGFAMLVEDLKAAADEQRYRDAEAGIIREI